jgi:hypothetical protein
VTDPYLRHGKILSTYAHLYPNAWKQVDEFRARRKELGDWADWYFLPLAGIYAIVSNGKSLQSPNQAQYIRQAVSWLRVRRLAPWRVAVALRLPLGGRVQFQWE